MTDQPYELGRYFCANQHHALLHHILDNVLEYRRNPGIAMEFGVGEGHSLRCIARYLPVMGFDSFDGLPEDWRPGFSKGMFASEPPDVENTRLVHGLFTDTLPKMNWHGLAPVRLVHIDCDLYSSTQTVLDHIGPVLKPGTVVIFDEWHNYPEAEQHEQRAWREFVSQHDIAWTVIGHGIQQWGIRIV